MEERITTQILDLLYTMQEACVQLFQYAQAEHSEQFQQTARDMETGLGSILASIQKPLEQKDKGCVKLEPICRSVAHSLERICGFYLVDRARCLEKIEYELLPLIQEACLQFYFFGYAIHQENGIETYYREAMIPLSANSYIDEAMETGTYRYEVSIVVLAYNKLDYTKRCVQSLLSNIPEGLNYELILINHGSTDDTKRYFEQIAPTKQLDILVNGGGMPAYARVVEGEFVMMVSNDVLIMPNAIQNLLACIRSDPKIAWVVPTTPNISNLQTIAVKYSTEEEMVTFAKQNNHTNPFRWEQRVRLCNPIDIKRSSVWFSSQGLGLNGYFHSAQAEAMSFPDDRVSLLLRRHGYKMMLAKDAYCHHFGSVTLKDEIQKKNEQKFYDDGRREFHRVFGVDPWGTGFCYSPLFLQRMVGEVFGHIEVLGMNCGLGSNSLKVKEQVREYGRNSDVTLTNITDASIFFEDLCGVSDATQQINSYTDFCAFIEGKQFHYIVWEDPFLQGKVNTKVYRQCWDALLPGGIFFIKEQPGGNSWLSACTELPPLEKGWYVLKKRIKQT